MRAHAGKEEAAEMMMLFMGDMPLRKFRLMGMFTGEQLSGMIAAPTPDSPCS